MTDPFRPTRADAVRNRVRVLDAAFELFAQQGTAAGIGDIAALAGVGTGTVYRHFPTKDDLFRAVVADRFQIAADHGTTLQRELPAGEALFTFLRDLITGGAQNLALAEAIIGSDIDLTAEEAPFLAALETLVTSAHAAGALRTDIGSLEVKALIGACCSVAPYGAHMLSPVVTVVLDGMRPTD